MPPTSSKVVQYVLSLGNAQTLTQRQMTSVVSLAGQDILAKHITTEQAKLLTKVSSRARKRAAGERLDPPRTPRTLVEIDHLPVLTQIRRILGIEEPAGSAPAPETRLPCWRCATLVPLAASDYASSIAAHRLPRCGKCSRVPDSAPPTVAVLNRLLADDLDSRKLADLALEGAEQFFALIDQIGAGLSLDEIREAAGQVILTLPKHAGKSIASVDASDPTYLDWILDKAEKVSWEIKQEIINYRHPTPPQKRPRVGLSPAEKTTPKGASTASAAALESAHLTLASRDLEVASLQAQLAELETLARPTYPEALAVSRSLDDLAGEIKAAHSRVESCFRAGLEHARQVGRLLIEARKLLDHGQWLPWLAEHVEFTDRTARNYIRIAEGWEELVGKSETVSDLSVRGALQLLGRPTPSLPGPASNGAGQEERPAPSTPPARGPSTRTPAVPDGKPPPSPAGSESPRSAPEPPAPAAPLPPDIARVVLLVEHGPQWCGEHLDRVGLALLASKLRAWLLVLEESLRAREEPASRPAP